MENKETKKKKLPIYDLIINEFDEKTNVNYISLVENPAIEVDYYAFSKDEKAKFKFKIQDSVKRNLAGPLMIPNMPIYRVDENTGEEYYVTMSEQTIENAVKKFARNGFNNNINAHHSTDVPGAYLVENWIISDPKSDKSTTFNFSNLPKGTWFGVVHLEEDVWNQYIKSGELKLGGFSVEGIFSQGKIVGEMEFSKKEQEDFLSFLADILINWDENE